MLSRWIGLLALASLSVIAQEPDNKTYARPDRMVISHLDHPGIQPFIELIRSVYQEDLGIKVTFIASPAMRGFFLVNEGFSDADVLRIDSNAHAFDNIIVVPPRLVVGELLLLCRKGLECTANVFADPNVTILTNLANQRILDNYQFAAKLITNENLQDKLDMLLAGRVKYEIFGSYGPFTQSLRDNVEVAELKKLNLYHVINKRHAPLVPALELAIKRRLRDTAFLRD